jgi:hypothetical protein
MKGKKAEESRGYKRITIERLREFPGLENLSDHGARQVIDASKRQYKPGQRNAVIYTRVSAKEQADTNQSLEKTEKILLAVRDQT